MKKLIVAASALALAACSGAEEAEVADDTAMDDAPEVTANIGADGQPTPGMYRVTTAEGEVYMEDVKADGTYVATDDAGEVVETGRWEQPSPDQYCTTVDEEYHDEEEDGSRKCNTEQLGDDGVWTSTNAAGETATVERVES